MDVGYGNPSGLERYVGVFTIGGGKGEVSNEPRPHPAAFYHSTKRTVVWNPVRAHFPAEFVWRE